MKTNTYTNLHSHSDYSNLRLIDSINKISNMFTTAKDLGLKGLALTDHEALSGHLKAIEFIEGKKKDDESWKDFKLILGNEIYLCRNGLNKDTVEKGEKYPHFILIALDDEGHHQLRQLSTRAWGRSYMMFLKRVPAWYSDIEEIVKPNQGHIVATSACFLPGQQIKTIEGYKSIENITSDDIVYNKFGEWEKVNYPTSRNYEGEGYLLHRQGDLEPIRCTSNHKFLVSSNNYENWAKTKDSLLQWKTAAEIKTQTGGTKDYGVRPLNTHFSNHDTIKKEEYQYSLFTKKGKRKTGTSDVITITPEIMRLFGLWLGDGHIDCGQNPRIGFTFNIKEFSCYYQSFVKQALEDIGGNWTITKKEKNNRVDISCSSLDVYELFAYLFDKRHAKDKMFPNKLKHISKELDYNLLFGYLLADGYFRKRERSGECVSASVSKRLTKDYIEMCNDLGIEVSVYSRPESIDGDGIYHQESFYTSIASSAFTDDIKQTIDTNVKVNAFFENIIATQKRNRLTDKNGIEYLKIRFRKKEKILISEKVYCLNNNTHSFCCENMIVHNCLGNQIGIWFTQGKTELVDEHLKWCQETFGEGNFFLEMAPALYEEQIAYNKYLIELSEKYNIPLTIATDAHYGRPEDFKIHEAFLKSKEEDRETADFYKYTYIMSAEEIYRLMDYIEEDIITQALENTNAIADRVQGYNLYRPQTIPKLPDERNIIGFEGKLKNSRIQDKYVYINKYKNSEHEDDRYGVFLALDALKKLNLSEDKLKRHLDQIEMELEEMWVVSDKIGQRLMSYFLTIRVIIQKIWDEVGSITCPGRGSGPSSLVCCLLGISDGDPLEQGFDLWFYRFIHRERAELADWDFDSEASKKQAITDMVYRMCKEIGGDSVSVCTFGTEGSRSALLTAARGMGLSSDIGQYLSSLIGQNRGFNYSLEDTYNGNPEKDIPASKDFKNEINKYPGLYETACAISGLVTRLGQHACMSEGSQVLTLNGYKSIEDITTNDYVYTHKGRYRKVADTMVNPGKEMFEISSSYMLDTIKATGDHPIFIRQQDGSYVWKEVEKLEETDLMAIPINKNNILPSYKNLSFSYDLFWLIGRYLGDGWTETVYRKGKKKDWEDTRVIICCNKTDDRELKEIITHINNAGYTYYITEAKTTYKIHINNNIELHEYLDRFGHGASNKIVHSDILNSPKEYIAEFLKGYLSADGYLDPKRGIQECKSVSKNLIRGMSECLNKAYNNYGTFVHYKSKKCTIEGRQVNCRDNWKFSYTVNRVQKKLLVENEYIWIPIKEIKSLGTVEKTFNLEVMEDNSFTVNNIAVHNCGVLLYNGAVSDYNALATTPGGNRVSQFDLGDSEKMGSIKYDFLSTDALDKIHTCLDLLLEDGLIEWQGSLRETYNKYLHPDVLDRDEPEMWKMLNQGKIISAFQMDSIVAKQTLASIHPASLLELAAVNSLMRLVPEKGHKSPADEYLEYKINPDKLKREIEELKATEKEKEILYNYLKQYNGVLESQENMMQVTMIPEFTNFTFSEASKLRKIVAKKKLKEVDSFREFFIQKGIDNGCSEDVLKYIWDVQIKRQLGYSFNLIHCTYYSLIGLQEMNLAYHYPSIYWATAVMTVEAGALDTEKTVGTNYAKVSAAIGRVAAEGYKVELPLINKANFSFTPDAKNNKIIYGLKGASEIGDEFVKTIIANRPYMSAEDFVEKCVPQKKQMINLIKAGAFTEFEDRRVTMSKFLSSITPKKSRITLQNMGSLIENKLIPNELERYIYLYNFNKYIKQSETPNGFKIDARASDFLNRTFPELEYRGFLDSKTWKKTYEKSMSGIKEWMRENEESLVTKLQEKDMQEIWDKHCLGSNSAWEMDVLGFYYSGHELANIKEEGLVNLSEAEDSSYKNSVTIAGTVLGKDAYKHVVIILTTEGVVSMKLTKESFATYNKTISQIVNGEKKTFEKSWFIKGTLILAKGYKVGEVFRVRQLSKIVEIDDLGDFKSTKYRYGEV